MAESECLFIFLNFAEMVYSHFADIRIILQVVFVRSGSWLSSAQSCTFTLYISPDFMAGCRGNTQTSCWPGQKVLTLSGKASGSQGPTPWP